MRQALLAAAAERKNPVHAKVCLKVQDPGFLAAKSAEALGEEPKGEA